MDVIYGGTSITESDEPLQKIAPDVELGAHWSPQLAIHLHGHHVILHWFPDPPSPHISVNCQSVLMGQCISGETVGMIKSIINIQWDHEDQI